MLLKINGRNYIKLWYILIYMFILFSVFVVENILNWFVMYSLLKIINVVNKV